MQLFITFACKAIRSENVERRELICRRWLEKMGCLHDIVKDFLYDF